MRENKRKRENVRGVGCFLGETVLNLITDSGYIYSTSSINSCKFLLIKIKRNNLYLTLDLSNLSN